MLWPRAGIDRADIGPPLLERPAPRLARARIVGDVVDGAAKRVDLVHGFALGARQNPHPEIERGARGALGRWGALGHSRTPRLLRRERRTSAETARCTAQHAE